MRQRKRERNSQNTRIGRKREERIEFPNKEIEKEIERNDLEELIIDRSKTPGEINNQIDSSAEEFQKLEGNKEDGVFADERGEGVQPEEEENPLRENEVDNPRGAERPKLKGRERGIHRGNVN